MNHRFMAANISTEKAVSRITSILPRRKRHPSRRILRRVLGTLPAARRVSLAQHAAIDARRKDVLERCSARFCLGEVMLVEERRSQPNHCVVLMFIHLDGDKLPSTTPRRVLLDTGADSNLISHAAHVELNLEKQPYQGLVHSIGGYTELDSTVLLQWHFQSRNPGSGQSPHRYYDHFSILPRESAVNFDCILGRPWILDNWPEFIALVEHNRKYQAVRYCGTRD